MKPSQHISPKFDMKVLLIDDDEDFANGLKIFLEKFNIATVIESRITSAEKQLKKFEFDIILLDVMMPGGSGFDFLPTIRKMCDVPVIMLTALDEEDELVNGLDLGADDYITKPFSPKELVARLRAVNRRHSINKTDIKTVLDDLELFCNQSMARVNKVNIALTEVECHILHLLLNSKDHSVSRDLLYSQVLKRDMMPDDRSLDVHISNLRRKLGSHPTKGNRIRAIRGQGYALTK
ncbi:MAG: response regulator transcription factor [Gammaproteobacteria bacterium]|jgi:DNA-binding response OmpR family regulator